MNRLEEIIAHKRQEIRNLVPLTEKLRASALAVNRELSFERALRLDAENGLGLIAEVKKASPSAGDIAVEADPIRQARLYAEAGVSAISVLTDEKYFKGKLEYLSRIRGYVDVPLLRKDFTVHECQIYEAAVAGADAILLIVAALEQEELVRLARAAESVGLDVLSEVHDLDELERALDAEARIIGVNCRNLKTMQVDLTTFERVSEEVPDGVLLVAESGIRTVDDAALCGSWGADALLVGEALMRADDPGALAAAMMAARG